MEKASPTRQSKKIRKRNVLEDDIPSKRIRFQQLIESQTQSAQERTLLIPNNDNDSEPKSKIISSSQRCNKNETEKVPDESNALEGVKSSVNVNKALSCRLELCYEENCEIREIKKSAIENELNTLSPESIGQTAEHHINKSSQSEIGSDGQSQEQEESDVVNSVEHHTVQWIQYGV